jgi:hypothetical protein
MRNPPLTPLVLAAQIATEVADPRYTRNGSCPATFVFSPMANSQADLGALRTF